MSPRLEYTLSTGALALALTLLVGIWLEMGAGNAFLWRLGMTAGVAAMLAAAWVCGWRWLVAARPGIRRLAGMAASTVLVAMVLFFPLCLGLTAALAPEEGMAMWLHGAALFGLFGLVFGTLPALLATTPLAWRFLHRSDRRAAA
ncbi:hypothetical protein LDO26_08210 [Luteimonas sp. BDR2-5]|uniref:hypothetical protein n=1 Tax=Proluteimonas luteida TaxID=2878685 RepID=UPI001E602F37|nr:hypothetical protein [Luteimonas sp. BDR2-5]MCD9028192.1 hypothetical protein [Luteimonas sp. BDR2-5]